MHPLLESILCVTSKRRKFLFSLSILISQYIIDGFFFRNTRSELQSVDTNYKDNKGDQKKPEEDLAQNLKELSLTKSEEPWIKSGEPWIPTILNDDPNVYIPSQFGQQSASSVSNTVSKSSSTPLKTDTTDSKKPSK